MWKVRLSFLCSSATDGEDSYVSNGAINIRDIAFFDVFFAFFQSQAQSREGVK